MTASSDRPSVVWYRSLFCRRLVLGLLVVVTWIGLARHLGSRGEAFWVLFPLWVLVGVRCLRAIPAPRAQHQHKLAKWGLKVAVVLLPIVYCFGMARFMGARVSVWEVVVAIWFFTLSLELLLLYLFQAFEWLRLRLCHGRGRAARVAILIGTKLVFYLLLFALLLPTLSIHRVKFISSPPPPEMELDFEVVRFPSRGEPRMNLVGWFFPVENPRGTVLACHGAGANRGDIVGLAWMLREEGFQVLCFDFRGHGESDGHTISFGDRERDDVLGAWDYLVGRKDVDRGRIFGYGISMGAASLLMALPEMPDMKAVVADSAFSDLDRMVHHQYRFVPGLLRELPVAVTRWVGWLDSGLDVDRVNPQVVIGKVDLPILFIHGVDDTSIPPGCSVDLHEYYAGPKRLMLVPDAGHGMSANEVPDEYQQAMRDWFIGAVGE